MTEYCRYRRRWCRNPSEKFGDQATATTRLKIVLVPVVHRLAAVRRSGAIDGDRIREIVAMRRGVQAVLEKYAERNGGLHFKSFRFIHRAFQAIPKTKRESKVWTELPGILQVFFVGLSGKIPFSGRSGPQRTPSLSKLKLAVYCENLPMIAVAAF